MPQRQVSVKIPYTGVVHCPFCGRKVIFKWERDGRLNYWDVETECPHFRGAYSGTDGNYALFELKWRIVRTT